MGALFDPSICMVGSTAPFGFAFCLGERDLSPWQFGPFWIVTWSGGKAGTFGKESARAGSRRLTETVLVSVPDWPRQLVGASPLFSGARQLQICRASGLEPIQCKTSGFCS